MKSYDYQNRKGINEISWGKFQQLCKLLVEKVSGDKIDIILGIARGGLYPATLISAMLQKEFYPLRITRRENDLVKFDQPVWKVDVTGEIKGKAILIVDDITDTGETLKIVAERARNKGANLVKTATLASHAWASPKPDYIGIESDELLIFPWDTQILVNGSWQLHPELQEAKDKKK